MAFGATTAEAMRILASIAGKGQEEEDAERPIWAVTESLVPQQGPASSHSPCPDCGPTGCLSGERHLRHLRKGLVFLGAFPGMERSIAVRKPMNHKASRGQTLKPTLFSFGCYY